MTTTLQAPNVNPPGAPANQNRNQNEGFMSKSHRTVVKTTAIIQIVVGVISIIFQSVSTVVNSQHYDEESKDLNKNDSSVHVGIWCGILFSVNGIIGVISTKNKSLAWVNTLIASNSVIILFALIQLGFSGAAINEMTGLFSHCKGRNNYNWSIGQWTQASLCDETLKSVCTAMNALMIICSLAYIVLAFIASCSGCAGICYRETSHPTGFSPPVIFGRRNQQGMYTSPAFQQGASFPTQGGVQMHSFTQAGGYPPQGGAYPAQGGAYPPQSGAYPSQVGAYPPQGGAYPSQGGAYPPQGGAYPSQSGTYPAQAGSNLSSGTYPTQQHPAAPHAEAAAPPTYEAATAPPDEKSEKQAL